MDALAMRSPAVSARSRERFLELLQSVDIADSFPRKHSIEENSLGYSSEDEFVDAVEA